MLLCITSFCVHPDIRVLSKVYEDSLNLRKLDRRIPATFNWLCARATIPNSGMHFARAHAGNIGGRLPLM
jgi:hypothetical protein